MASYRLSAFADEADKMLASQLEALGNNGISLIELRGVDGKSCADLTNEDVREAKKKLDGAGVKLSALGSPYGKYPIEQDFAPHREAFKRGLEITNMLGAERIRMFSFFVDEAEADQKTDEVVEKLSKMVAYAEKHDVILLHENEKGIYGDIDDRCVDLMQVYGDRMGCIFDPANFIQCGVKPIEAFPKLEKYITYMHIKDAVLGSGAVVPAGMGDGDLPKLLDRLNGENVTLTIEPHLTVFSGLDALQDEKVEHKFTYPDSLTAFNAAVTAIKTVLTDIGFAEGGNGVWKR